MWDDGCQDGTGFTGKMDYQWIINGLHYNFLENNIDTAKKKSINLIISL